MSPTTVSLNMKFTEHLKIRIVRIKLREGACLLKRLCSDSISEITAHYWKRINWLGNVLYVTVRISWFDLWHFRHSRSSHGVFCIPPVCNISYYSMLIFLTCIGASTEQLLNRSCWTFISKGLNTFFILILPKINPWNLISIGLFLFPRSLFLFHIIHTDKAGSLSIHIKFYL